VGETLADRSVVRLERPRDERDEARIPILELPEPLEMHQALIARLTVAKHHRRSSRNAKRMGYVHHIEPLLGVAMSAALLPNLVDKDLASSSRYLIEPGLLQLAQYSLLPEPSNFRQVIDLGRREAVK